MATCTCVGGGSRAGGCHEPEPLLSSSPGQQGAPPPPAPTPPPPPPPAPPLLPQPLRRNNPDPLPRCRHLWASFGLPRPTRRGPRRGLGRPRRCRCRSYRPDHRRHSQHRPPRSASRSKGKGTPSHLPNDWVFHVRALAHLQGVFKGDSHAPIGHFLPQSAISCQIRTFGPSAPLAFQPTRHAKRPGTSAW